MMVLEMILNGEAGTKAQRAAIIRIIHQVTNVENLASKEARTITVLNALRTKEKLPI
jgi:hypothetical protein